MIGVCALLTWSVRLATVALVLETVDEEVRLELVILVSLSSHQRWMRNC